MVCATCGDERRRAAGADRVSPAPARGARLPPRAARVCDVSRGRSSPTATSSRRCSAACCAPAAGRRESTARAIGTSVLKLLRFVQHNDGRRVGGRAAARLPRSRSAAARLRRAHRRTPPAQPGANRPGPGSEPINSASAVFDDHLPAASTTVPSRAAPRAVSALAPAALRGRRRPGARHAHAAQRRQARPPVARLPVHRARGAPARPASRASCTAPSTASTPQDGDPCNTCALCRGRAGRPRARPDRDRRGLEPRHRRHARPARQGRVSPGRGPLQGLHHRRGPRADRAGLGRLPQDARGTAAARDLRAGDHRGAQSAGDDRLALPALRLSAHPVPG